MFHSIIVKLDITCYQGQENGKGQLDARKVYGAQSAELIGVAEDSKAGCSIMLQLHSFLQPQIYSVPRSSKVFPQYPCACTALSLILHADYASLPISLQHSSFCLTTHTSGVMTVTRSAKIGIIKQCGHVISCSIITLLSNGNFCLNCGHKLIICITFVSFCSDSLKGK